MTRGISNTKRTFDHLLIYLRNINERLEVGSVEPGNGIPTDRLSDFSSQNHTLKDKQLQLSVENQSEQCRTQ